MKITELSLNIFTAPHLVIIHVLACFHTKLQFSEMAGRFTTFYVLFSIFLYYIYISKPLAVP